MRRQIYPKTTPIAYTFSGHWEINEVLITELQRCGAANVDKGFRQLVHTLLGLAHAQYLRCDLVDGTQAFNPIILATMTAGLQAVMPVPHASQVKFSYEIQPHRHLEFEFISTQSNRQVHLDAVNFLLCTQHRWLVWLDLSHGPVSHPGGIPSQQRKVLLSLLRGMSEKQMASELNLNINTAHLYVKQLYRLFGVRNRASLMSLWLNPPHSQPLADRHQ